MEADEEVLNELVLAKSGLGVDDALEYLDWENDEHREYLLAIHNLETSAGAIEATLDRVARIVADGVVNDQSTQHIADRAQCSTTTVQRWRRDERVKKVVNLIRRARRLINAPPLAHRVQLAWRIALRNELVNPKVSLAAIDLINKTTSTYAPEEKTNTAPTIVLGNFTINNNGHVSMDKAPIEGRAEAIEIDVD